MDRTKYQQLINHLQKGSYVLSCKFVEEHQLDPIQGKHALQFLCCCSQSLESKYSTKHLTRFLTYLSFKDIHEDDVSKYISGLYYILLHLIGQCEWKCILELQHMILPSFSSNIPTSQKKYYSCYAQKLIHGISKHKDENSDQHLDQVFCSLIAIALRIEHVCNEKALLKYFYNIAATFQNKSYISSLAVLGIDILKEAGIDLVTKANFKTLMLILQACFANHSSSSNNNNNNKHHEYLVSTINKLVLYFTKTSIKGVMEYLKSNLLLLTTMDKSPKDLAGFATPLQLLHKVTKTGSLTFYLEEVVYFCYKLNLNSKFQNSLIKFNGDNKKEVLFTKELQNTLTIYFSHAKSQGAILKNMQLECCCGCSITKAIVKAIKIQLNAFQFVTLFITQVVNQPEIPSEFYSIMYKLVDKCFEMLNILREANCKEITSLWEQLGIPIYNLCIQLFNQKRHSDSEQFLGLLIRCMFIYGGDKCLLHTERTTKSTFLCYIECLVVSKRWDDAMDMCALSIYKYPANIRPIIPTWNNILYNCKSEESICDVLDRKSMFLTEISQGKCNITDENTRRDLYIYEIQNYVTRFKSINRIEHCFRKLVTLLPSAEYISFLIGLPFEIVQQLKLTSFITNVSTTDPNLDVLHLGVYKYFTYKDKLSTAVTNFKALPKSTAIVKIKDPEDDEMESDDIVSSASNFSHVRIDEHDKIIALLKESVTLLCDKRLKKTAITICLLDLVISIAQELELQCYEKEARRAWSLAYNMARQLKAHQQVLHVISFLLNYEPENAKELITLSEDIFKTDKSIDHFTRCKFFSALATYSLKNDQYVDFHQNYDQAESAFYESGGSFYRDDKNDLNFERDFISGYYALMMSTAEFLPCKHSRDDRHGDYFYLPSHIWHGLLPYYTKSRPKQYSEFLNLFFTLGEQIVWKYLWCGMIVDAKIYAMTLISVAENVLLTHRVCRLLVFLAKLNYHEGKIDACQIRVDGLLEILHLSYIQPNLDELLTDEFKNRVLIRPASPIPVKVLRLPVFVYHETHCQCTPCSSNEFQNSVIEAMHIEVLIASLRNDDKTCGTSLKKIFELFDILQCKKQFRGTVVHSDLLWTSINYCKRIGNREKMDQNMRLLKDKLERRTYKNYYLYNHLVNLIVAMIMADTAKKSKPQAVCKTPELKLDNQKSPTFHTPKSITVLAVPSTSSNMGNLLGVPSLFDERRTRLRSRNLCTGFETGDEKQTPKPEKGKQKTTSIPRIAKSSNKRKGLR